ncbi:hypothetical protein E3P92_01844 [Wallemia ichthyophaga]|uniref:Large ribosomal subunit protein uL30-like ferredoxin-like fold domain-containing protein n=1 Tax=Wallemia ichthyophaga TaxID=245174 RepID=A0A4T0G0F4_WALIC|nr:hypothetical protein E3P98_00503 [Wallemia ichthyophaga]TIA94155.1 hypothetical protein E3P97_00439 [Wallemia ichthyophaga]TIB01141.1 hypothetical protein E3P95_01401 [Wallemia ichthyophaga]TIB02172.1 hypothetical protein E3P94_01533 [Wallemia ichthyophaga]TIB14804.1 hypothetical protein E3P92_01844 [Wallemia ichthyophaga]
MPANWLQRALPYLPKNVLHASTSPNGSQRTLEALGLNKRMAVVLHPHSQDTAGQLLRVKELVKVDNIYGDDLIQGRVKSVNGPSSGFTNVGSAAETRRW